MAKKKSSRAIRKATTYEFQGYPAEYRAEYRWHTHPGALYYRGWMLGSLTLFSFGSPKEAQKAVDRLRRVYQMTKRKDLLKDKRLLKIERVERSPLG